MVSYTGLRHCLPISPLHRSVYGNTHTYIYIYNRPVCGQAPSAERVRTYGINHGPTSYSSLSSPSTEYQFTVREHLLCVYQLYANVCAETVAQAPRQVSLRTVSRSHIFITTWMGDSTFRSFYPFVSRGAYRAFSPYKHVRQSFSSSISSVCLCDH